MRKSIILVFILTLSFVNANSQNKLNYYIASALQNSPLLQKQENNNKIIDLDLKQFNAIYKSPKVSINSNVILSPILNQDGNTNNFQLVSSGSSNYIGYDLGASNGGQFQAFLSVNQPLFTSKYYSAQNNKASISKEINENTVQLTKADLQQIVTHQYILCLQSQSLKSNTQNIVKIIEQQIVEMKPMVKAGIYKYIDLKLLEIELQNNQIEYERLNGEYLNNVNDLNLLSGIKDNTQTNIQNIDLELNTPLKTSNLFTSQFKLDSLAVQADQKIFELQYLPQVNAFGDTGLNATYLPDFNRLGFSVGVSLQWNLFDGNQKHFKSQQSQLLFSNINTDRQYFENQNSIRKSNILNQISNLNSQITLIENQLTEYNKLLALYQIELKHSLVSVLELKNIIKDIAIKQQAKTNTSMVKAILINNYNYWNQ